MRLRHFKTDWSATDNDQMIRLGAILEYCFIGEIACFLQPRNGRCRGPGSGSDDKAPRLNTDIIDFQFKLRDKTSKPLQYFNAKPFKPLHRIMRRN